MTDEKILSCLNNFQYAIENCGGMTKNGTPVTGKDIIELLTSRQTIKNYIEDREKEIKELNEDIQRLNALLNPSTPPQPNP